MAGESLPLVLRHRPHGALLGPEAAALSGLELLRGWIERRLPDPPLTRFAGVRLTDAGPGMATMAMPASPWWQSAAGVFLAGTLAFLADGPLGSAVLTAAPPGVAMATAELAIDFLRPATIRSSMIIGRARLIHSSHSQGLSEAFVDDGRGRVLAHATSRGVLVPVPPVRGAPELDLDSEGVELHALETVEGDVLDQRYWNSTPGSEFVEAMLHGRVRPPVLVLSGVRLSAYSDGTATATMTTTPWLSNAFGVLYGGALTFLIDFAVTAACLTTLPAATAFAPMDLKVNFLRPVIPDGGVITARATTVHRGRSIAVLTADVVDAAGRSVAVASESVLILPGRPWTRPVSVEDEVPAPTAVE